MFCAAWGHSQSLVPSLITKVTKNSVATVYKSWRLVLKNYVKVKQASIKFGAAADAPLDEYEVDEAVFRKEDIGNNHVQWQEMIGLKRRGDRKPLVLHKRAAASSTSARAENGRAVPPPMSKPEWVKLRGKHVGRRSLGHADGAPAYKSHGKDSGKNKAFTKITAHDDDGKKVLAVAGTQCLDERHELAFVVIGPSGANDFAVRGILNLGFERWFVP